MKLIEWNNHLGLNIDEIDEQHRKMFDAMNELYLAMREGKGKQFLGEALDRLTHYIEIHFRNEERYFIQYGYTEARKHREEHRYFEGKIAEFKNRAANNQLSVCIELLFFLSEWFRNHIQHIDRKYVPLFHANNLK